MNRPCTGCPRYKRPPPILPAAAATIKVIIVGNGSVGKSSMAARYCKGVFTNSYKKTIGARPTALGACGFEVPPPSPARAAGVDFLEKSIELGNGETVKLLCWDTAGQEEFDALTSSYYRGASRLRALSTARGPLLRTPLAPPCAARPRRRGVLRPRLLDDGPRLVRRA